MRFADVTYFHNRTADAASLIDAHYPNVGYLRHLPAAWSKVLVKFAAAEESMQMDFGAYHCFRGRPSRTWLPLRANRFIARLRPDVVLIHGLVFPLQVLALKAFLPRNTAIIVQHHAEAPAHNAIMRRLQRLAGKYVQAYLFATRELSGPWTSQQIIGPEKVFEVMEGSSVMKRMDKKEARHYLGLGDDPIFLWVGRLDNNKDPLTAVKAFEAYLTMHPHARLYMVYQQEELLPQVRAAIRQPGNIILKGKLSRQQLAYWYSAADYYLSTSHSEGSGYALIEAMSCGAVPVVTDIPSFRKITAGGAAGFLFGRGDAAALAQLLATLPAHPGDRLVTAVLRQFESALSFVAIARQVEQVCSAIRLRHSG